MAAFPRIALNGSTVEIADAPAMTTLLDWLREHARLSGTKEGCAEGDCGACTVVVERLGPDGRIRRAAINACLAMIGQMDGLGVRSIEGLSSTDGPLHPVQAAFVAAEATQCGFCTPGLVMSAYAFAAGGEPNDPSLIHDALAGNLCRCTGYRPIVEAVARVAPLEQDPLESADADLAETLAGIERPRGVCFESGGRRFHVPRTLAEALALRAAHPDALLLAGGTDLGLLASLKRERIPEIIHLSRVRELALIEDGADGLVLGAAVTYAEAFDVLTRRHPHLRTYLTRLGSRQIRNMGTIGGNLGTASPIGDALPILLALDARVRLSSAARGSREVASAAFFTGYRRTVMAPDELIETVTIPNAAVGTMLFVDKLSKRRDQDISTLCAAYRLTLDDGILRDVRLAYGGLAPLPKRAVGAERALEGRVLDEAVIMAAAAALSDDFQPISDWRGGAEYRLTAARNLLRRLHWRISQPAFATEVDAL